jgi:glycosyltransferase involved in cell wall biosynthesis
MTAFRAESSTFQTHLDNPSSSMRLRVLFLAPFAPHLQASHGGSRVIAQLISHLSQRHAVGLCYLRAVEEPAIDDVLRECCDVVEEVLISEPEDSGIRSWFRRIRGWKKLVSGQPLWAIDRFSPDYGERAQRLLRTWQPDIVQLEFHVMGQYLSALIDYPAPRILVQHEPGEKSAQEKLKFAATPGRIMPQLDILAWKRFERDVIRQVQAVVVFTERDHKVVEKLGQKVPIIPIPIGTELPEHSLNPTGEAPLSLLFVGNFKHFPNVDAALRLITAIFPPVQAQFTESRLYIVGSHPPAELQRRASESVIITGFVPNLTPYLDRAALLVLPLRMGGGMRVKVLEALAHGKAVIASPIAIEGLDLQDGHEVKLAESDQEFSQAAIDLLREPELRAGLANRARAWACANLSWNNTVLAYEDLYDRLLKDP